MALFHEIVAKIGVPRHTYVCGATSFVDAATRHIIDAGVDFASIRTERYGGDPKRV